MSRSIAPTKQITFAPIRSRASQLDRLIEEKEGNVILAASMGIGRRPGVVWVRTVLWPVVWASFEADGPRSPVTMLEIRRRFELCAKRYRELRSDLQWSEDRIVNHLPLILRCELDGKPWEPPPVEDAWIPAKLADPAGGTP